ncbi:MAG: class I tRNA ligase family protein [Candidatus Paceibacterota bacterium]|jgi:leucyl-tRNA synthetase
MKQYDHLKIEKKWQKEWEAKKVYKTANPGKMKKHYVLDMFPYPSGAGLHVGHPRGYIASDVYARMKRMQGFNVLHPMGFDSFGLPAEQYAIQTKKHPGPFTEKLVELYKKQLEIIGFSYDWSREVATHRPEYYKWTQWIFLKLYDAWYDQTKDKARDISELVKIFNKNGNENVNAVCDQNTPTFSAKEWKQMSEMEKQNMLMKYRLAYEGYSEVNWCSKLGTVLANDEIVDGPDGKPVSERGGFGVEKKSMRQWFMRITAYADRLLSGLEGLDWSSHIKEIQKNWIGKSEGSEISFKIVSGDKKDLDNPLGRRTDLGSITVFTTRADTLFGVTYVVLAPGHLFLENIKTRISNWKEVEKYLDVIKNKSEEDRIKEGEKTGIELKGIMAINPANGEVVPVWIADYVLANYGTGAVMAVPAHDERDFEFAKKYKLPIRDVVAKMIGEHHHENNIRDVAEGVIIKDDQVLVMEYKNQYGLPGGGIEEGETPEQALLREIREEIGYTDVEIVEYLGQANRYYFSDRDQKKKVRHAYGYVVKILSNKKNPTAPHEIDKPVWLPISEAIQKVQQSPIYYQSNFIDRAFSGMGQCFVDNGVLIQSGQFDSLTSEEARKKITEFVGGKLITKYKMRDAIFARQRYWGEPIPLSTDKDGIIHEVKKLPLKLPNVKSYEPAGTGESPLAGVKDWVKHGYETNTMPGWAGSSWYFLRYMDPKNKSAIASKQAIKYWKDVDMYVGGAEHATGHLLYSRFWHKFLKDIGIAQTEEPFKALRNQGLIGGADGRKMSKRWGNVINPDEIVKTYGADTLRVYEAFMGPFDQSLPWSTESIIGSRRFIEKVWRMGEKTILASHNSFQKGPRVARAGLSGKSGLDQTVFEKNSAALKKVLHKTIKKVTEDIANFNFNTAVSAMMICANEMEKAEYVSVEDFKKFLQILAPFAPHASEDLWRELGEKKSIHLSEWPLYDKKKIIDDTITIAIQVNSKVRAEISIPIDMSENDLKKLVLENPATKQWTEGKEIKRIIHVKGKLVNIVIA